MEFDEKSLRMKWIPGCNYYNHLGHIRPHCFTYLADLRKKIGKNINSYTTRNTKKEDKFGAQIKGESIVMPRNPNQGHECHFTPQSQSLKCETTQIFLSCNWIESNY